MTEVALLIRLSLKIGHIMLLRLFASLLSCTIASVALLTQCSSAFAADSIDIHKRYRSKQADGSWSIAAKTEKWQANQTAIIVCDMWESHHCLNAVRRVMELAPTMNRILEEARSRGVLIIHAPSNCMETYKDYPGRKLAQRAPMAANLPSDIGVWCKHIPAEDGGEYPIDQSTGGVDDDPAEHLRWEAHLKSRGLDTRIPWKAQIATLRIDDSDAISDSGVEIWNLMESRGIDNVILMGVHTNMCVLGRPFGLRQMSKNGKNVVLMRDMTDTMYDPSKAPYVNHFFGTELIVTHIEKFVCPTITSVDFLGGEPFRFSQDKRNVVMVIGDDEYKTEQTLPAFAQSELEPLGFHVTIIHADPKSKNDFPGLEEAVKQADVVVISARRRTPPSEQLEAIQRHIASGRAVVGIRTASHAFSLRKSSDSTGDDNRLSQWPDFDPTVLGGNYTGHHANGITSQIRTVPEAAEHPILRGVKIDELIGHGSLYKVSPLAVTATPLLLGSIPDHPSEPIAWTNQPSEPISAASKLLEPTKPSNQSSAGAIPTNKPSDPTTLTKQAKPSRVFYTSLGHPDDFATPAFKKLLLNGLLWTLSPNYTNLPPLAGQ